MASNQDIKNIGDDGEKAFAQWLNDQSIGYLHINNKKNGDDPVDSFSLVFTDHLKRPDFFVLLPSTGFIAVDVKHYSPVNNGSEFTLSIATELSKSLEFERVTRLYLWYAYKNRSDPKDTNWYFISAHKAMEVGIKHRNRKNKQYYLSIHKKHFEVLASADDFQKLFKARIGAIGQISRAVEKFFSG